MKTVIFGDIHGRTIWKDIIEKEQPDRVIFLGDYVSTHEMITSQQQIDNLEEILKFKESHKDSVILLRGNHDLEALDYYWASCYPCTSLDIHQYLGKNKERFLSNSQWLFEEDGVVYSHAGITRDWLDKVEKVSGSKFDVGNFSELNNLEPSELFGFSADSRFDSYGTGKTQPLTWVRPQTLLQFGLKDVLFVVGHTTQHGAGKPVYISPFCMYTNARYGVAGIWLCDILGEGGYLLNVDGKFVAKNIKDDAEN